MSGVTGIIARRAVSAIITLIILITALFVLLNTLGDPALVFAGDDATDEMVEAVRVRLGLDAPLWQRYLNYLGDLLRGDAGMSWRSNRPVTTMLLERVPATLQLASAALVIAIIIAIPIGTYSAIKPGSWFDSAARAFAVGSNSIPGFWLAILMIVIFAVNLGVLPAGGIGTWKHLVLPALALSTNSLPLMMRVTRSAMLEVMNKDYIRSARSKGLPERTVITRHALRNSMIPVVTVTALRVGYMVSGTLLLETVFSYPGVGRLAVQAMSFRDYPVVLFFAIAVGIAIVTVNLVADIIYTLVDPRVRVS